MRRTSLGTDVVNETRRGGVPPDPLRPAGSAPGLPAAREQDGMVRQVWAGAPRGRDRPAGRGSDGPGPPALVHGLRYDLVSQKIFPISSIASSSFWPCAGSSDFFASPASFVAFQNMSCSSGNFSRCSGLK